MPLLTYAAIYSSAEIVQILVDAGTRDSVPVIDLTECSIGFTKSAPMIAKERGNADIARVLECAQAA